MRTIRVFVNILLTISFIIGIALSIHTSNSQAVASNPSPIQATPTITPLPTPTPIVEANPVKIEIPDLGVSTNIQSVGQATEGQMDVPSNFTDTAWYNLGPKPGEVGNSLIDGHYDTETGAPAVFYYIRNLHQGSQINVITANGKTLHFIVTQVTSYPSDNFPFDIVAGSTDKRMLNLITCGGQWDRADHNYSQRSVVFSELQSESN